MLAHSSGSVLGTTSSGDAFDAQTRLISKLCKRSAWVALTWRCSVARSRMVSWALSLLVGGRGSWNLFAHAIPEGTWLNPGDSISWTATRSRPAFEARWVLQKEGSLSDALALEP